MIFVVLTAVKVSNREQRQQNVHHVRPAPMPSDGTGVSDQRQADGGNAENDLFGGNDRSAVLVREQLHQQYQRHNLSAAEAEALDEACDHERRQVGCGIRQQMPAQYDEQHDEQAFTTAATIRNRSDDAAHEKDGAKIQRHAQFQLKIRSRQILLNKQKALIIDRTVGIVECLNDEENRE